jgi:hypothetical protein
MNLEIQNLTGGYLDYLLAQHIEIIPDIVDLLHSSNLQGAHGAPYL